VREGVAVVSCFAAYWSPLTAHCCSLSAVYCLLRTIDLLFRRARHRLAHASRLTISTIE
jgi:hypothetical protein